MDKEEEFFHKLAENLSDEYDYVKTGKMMSSDGISYKKKFFAFYYKQEITLRLGKDFVPKDHGIKKWKYLNPFKKKAPMKNWFQIPYSEKKNWKKLAKIALCSLANELNS
jgi:TfoX/Sxy family transcriptional regulator of competence genes